MAEAAKASLQMKTSTAPNSTETNTTNQLSTLSSTIADHTDIRQNLCEPIEISDDDDSLPITSANSFLTHVSNSRTNQNVINKTLEPG
jgi:hypothetical protein